MQPDWFAGEVNGWDERLARPVYVTSGNWELMLQGSVNLNLRGIP